VFRRSPCPSTVSLLIALETTEPPEVLESGWGILVGTEPDRILHESRLLLEDEEAYRARCSGPNPFGDGFAARRIVGTLSVEWEARSRSELMPRPEGRSI
jgi:UDP-N-acetylglucosamine 2-epimerase